MHFSKYHSSPKCAVQSRGYAPFEKRRTNHTTNVIFLLEKNAEATLSIGIPEGMQWRPPVFELDCSFSISGRDLFSD
jgi:hypothetical protein